MIEPDIVKELREEEKLGLFNNKNIYLKNETKSCEKEIFKNIELILKLQKGVMENFLSKIKKGEIKSTKSLILSLNELSNFYNSEYWKIMSNEISVEKHILSFIHLVNTYIEHLEQCIDKDKNSYEIKKLKNVILTLNNIRG